MNVHVSYKVPKTPDIEKEITHQIEKIQKRLQVFRPELVHLKACYRSELGARGNGRLAEPAAAVRPTGGPRRKQPAPWRPRSKRLLTNWFSRSGGIRNCCARAINGGTGAVDRRILAEPGVPFEQTLAAVLPPTISADDIGSYVNANLCAA